SSSRVAVEQSWRVTVSTQTRPVSISNPLALSRSLLAALAAVRSGERVVLQWQLAPADGPRALPTRPGTPAGASPFGAVCCSGCSLGRSVTSRCRAYLATRRGG